MITHSGCLFLSQQATVAQIISSYYTAGEIKNLVGIYFLSHF